MGRPRCEFVDMNDQLSTPQETRPAGSRIRTVEHESAKGSWRIQFLRPAPSAASLVHRFCDYSECNTEFVRRREPPAGLATLVFNLGPALRVQLPDGSGASYEAGGAFYCGMSDSFAITETDRAQQGVQVSLTPLGARRLSGFPLGEVGDRLIDPTDLFGRSARRTTERLQEANTSEFRLAIIEQEIELALARPSRPLAPDLVWSMRRLRSTSGRISIAALAEELGCSRKHLSVRFKREFGMAPKLFARVLRFDLALRGLRSGAVASWAELADACGYSDQAHLCRDFTVFAGSPPETFSQRALPDEGGFVD
jgi:AraC-like DNA-binding protein